MKTLNNTRIYLASRYSRAAELNGYKAQLEAMSFVVTSRWLDGHHQMAPGLSEQAADNERLRFAQEDWQDLMDADICINFTEEPRSTNGRGGRHVEFGAALATGKRCIVIGPRENVFHHLPQALLFPNWDAALLGYFRRHGGAR